MSMPFDITYWQKEPDANTATHSRTHTHTHTIIHTTVGCYKNVEKCLLFYPKNRIVFNIGKQK